jgi:hypothetical protein
MARNVVALCLTVQSLNQGGPVVGKGNFDPEKQAKNHNQAGPMIRNLTGSDRSGAMSEQHGQGCRSDESAPQKFVHLVGCLDANARARPGARPRPGVRKP